jgi:hypothetical protein
MSDGKNKIQTFYNLLRNVRNTVLRETLHDNKVFYSLLKRCEGYTAWHLNRVLDYKLEKYIFYKKMGYWPNLKNPRSMNEKILWKKVYDRNPLMPITADKYRVRSYVREVLGENRAGEILIPLLHATGDPETIPFERLPDDFIVKANHGCGMNIIVEDGNSDRDNILETCKMWLRTPQGTGRLEWAYQNIDRKIVIEELIRGENGRIPEDYKFYIFHGTCKLVWVAFERHVATRGTVYDSEWNALPVSWDAPRGPEIEKPRRFPEMLEIAEELGKNFDFVRVDLYAPNNRVYFGELTHYPASGNGRIIPKKFDYEFGQYWELKPGYWKR